MTGMGAMMVGGLAGAVAAAPARVSETAYDSGGTFYHGSGNAWPAFTSLNLSNCNIAVVAVTTANGGNTQSIDTTNSTSGWTQLSMNTQSTAQLSHAVYYKTSPTSSESLYIISSGAAPSDCFTAVLFRAANVTNISAANSVFANAVPDPPSLDTGASRPLLVLETAGFYAGQANVNAASTNYTNLLISAASVQSRTALASRTVTAQTEDPGVMGATGTNCYGVAMTVAMW